MLDWVAVGIDNGGTKNNGTVLDSAGRFLVDTMAELPSLVREGPDKAIQALVDSFDKVLGMTGTSVEQVRAVGLDTPGPASATGVLSTGGATNFGHPGWGGFDIRSALEERLGIPVVYNNDGMPRRCTPTTCDTAPPPRRAVRWRPSWAPASAAA